MNIFPISWRRNYTTEGNLNHTTAFCSLCAKLHSNEPPKSIPDLNKLYNQGKCSLPTEGRFARLMNQVLWFHQSRSLISTNCTIRASAPVQLRGGLLSWWIKLCDCKQLMAVFTKFSMHVFARHYIKAARQRLYWEPLSICCKSYF